MRKMALLFTVLLAMTVAFAAKAEDAKKDEAKKEEPKKDEPKKDEGTPTTLKGELSATSAGGTLLKVKDDNNKLKTYTLVPTADVAAQLATLAKKHAHADVTGTLAADGTTLKVTSVTEQAKDKKQGHGH